MITEILIATAYLAIAFIAWKGITRSEWRILRLILAAAVLAVSAQIFFDAVIRAVTATTDIGEVRKVGWPAMLAAIIALWFAPKWMQKRIEPEEA